MGNIKKKKNNNNNNNRKNSISNNQYSSIIRVILLIGVMVLIFYPPYLRGLYFEEEQLPTEIFAFILFFLYWVYKWIINDKKFLRTPIDYVSFGLTVVYFISIFVAINIRSAISEWIKYCMFFSVFLMVTDLVKSTKEKAMVLWTLIASAVGICIIGIDASSGENLVNIINSTFELLNIKTRFFGLYVDGRIHSTLQYPNALAIYLLALYFVIIGLNITSSSTVKRIVTNIVGYIIFMTYILTISRGTLLLLPLAFLLFALLASKSDRIKGSLYLLSNIFAYIVGSVLFIAINKLDVLFLESNKNWAVLLLGMGFTVLVMILTSKMQNLLEKISWKVYIGIFVSSGVCLIIIFITLLNSSDIVALSHYDSKADSILAVQKDIKLLPENDYKLRYSIEAKNDRDKEYACLVRISNKTERDVLFGGKKLIASQVVRNTEGRELYELNFKVPEDSTLVEIEFINYFQDTSFIMDEAKVVNPVTDKTVKKLILRYKYFDNILQRFENIQHQKSGIERGFYNKDAFKIFKDYWFLGAGGGAWTSLNFYYQSYLYWSTQAHNYFMQVATDTGIIGLVMFIALLLSLCITMAIKFKNRDKKTHSEYVIEIVLFTSIMTMFIHSLMDFDLSLSAVYLTLWSLIALFNTNTGDYEKLLSKTGAKHGVIGKISAFISRIPRINVLPVLAMVIVLALGFVPFSFIYASMEYKKSQELLKANDLKTAAQYVKSAANFDIFNPLYKIKYSDILISMPEVNENDLKKANKYAESAEKLSRYNVNIL
ncbi:MAG: O-antigen ligase family protein, partial [Clostridiaceae bacterium]|nr:O-antigen ligase family protein [Clostridiaceae bacterium]